MPQFGQKGGCLNSINDSFMGDFPGGTVVKSPPASVGDTGSSPPRGSGKIPHAAEQLRPQATTAEAHAPRARVPQQEKPPQ